jgi:hypothetical protein
MISNGVKFPIDFLDGIVAILFHKEEIIFAGGVSNEHQTLK